MIFFNLKNQNDGPWNEDGSQLNSDFMVPNIEYPNFRVPKRKQIRDAIRSGS